MRGSFGPLTFEFAKTPSSFKAKQVTNYAEHPRLEGKGVLQWTGHSLDRITMTWRFHAELPSDRGDYTDVEGEIAILQEILLLHEPHPLIMITDVGGRIYGRPYSAVGVFENLYVLESIDSSVRRFDANGIVWCCDCDVTLLENVEDGPAGEAGAGGVGALGGILGGFFGGLF